MSSQVVESRIKSAVMEDWNWALGYGIGKDVATGHDVFVHHSFMEDSVKTRGECTGFEGGPIGNDKRWLERRDVIYYVADADFPNIAFHVSLTQEDTMEASLPGDGTLGN
tara:strand:- start:399 stop:728 length:330 start_codon:yes stop_codon:yes gene_type:complete